MLNSISRITDINDCPFFDSISNTVSPVIFYNKLSTLLTWSVTSLQYGDHRPYVVFSLLRRWRDKYSERATRRDLSSSYPEEFLQDQLFDWLDESEGAGDEVNIGRVAAVFGKLVKEGLFGYAEYVQRLVARGEQGLSYAQVMLSCYTDRLLADKKYRSRNRAIESSCGVYLYNSLLLPY